VRPSLFKGSTVIPNLAVRYLTQEHGSN
jgi:hypothetical protein